MLSASGPTDQAMSNGEASHALVAASPAQAEVSHRRDGEEQPLRVLNNASQAITLALSCRDNRTVAPHSVANLTLSGNETMWVSIVPSGTVWDCEKGCETCFHIKISRAISGNVTGQLGYGLLGDDDSVEAANASSVTEIGDSGGVVPEVSEEFFGYGRDDSNATVVTLQVHHWATSSDTMLLVVNDDDLLDTRLDAPVLLRGTWNPWRRERRHRRRVCRNLCRFVTYRPGFRRRVCKMECRTGGRF